MGTDSLGVPYLNQSLRNLAFAPALDDEWQWLAQGGGNDAAQIWLRQWWDWEGRIYQELASWLHEPVDGSHGFLCWERLPLFANALLDWDTVPGTASGALLYLGDVLPGKDYTWRIRCSELPNPSAPMELHCLARRLPETYPRLGGEGQTYFFRMCLLARK